MRFIPVTILFVLTLLLGGCWHGTQTPPPGDESGLLEQLTTTTQAINSSTADTKPIYWGKPKPKGEIDITALMNTSTWKVYENKEIGFRFRYPSQFSINHFTDNKTARLRALEFTGQNGIKFDARLVTYIYAPEGYATYNDYYRGDLDNIFSELQRQKNIKYKMNIAIQSVFFFNREGYGNDRNAWGDLPYQKYVYLLDRKNFIIFSIMLPEPIQLSTIDQLTADGLSEKNRSYASMLDEIADSIITI